MTTLLIFRPSEWAGLDGMSDGGAGVRCRFDEQTVRVELRRVRRRAHAAHDGGAHDGALRGGERGGVASAVASTVGSAVGTELALHCFAPPRSAGVAHFSLALNAHHYLPPLEGGRFTYYGL